MTDFSIQAVLDNSNEISENFEHFDNRLSELKTYEGSIMPTEATLSTTIPFYNVHREAYGIKIVGQEFDFTNLSLNSFFQKVKSDVTIDDFNAVKDLRGVDGEPVGLDVLTAINKHTHRDNLRTASKEHKFLTFDGNLLNIVSPRYPDPTTSNFKFSSYLEAIRDTVSLNSSDVLKTELNWNPLTGDARARIFFDTLETPYGDSRSHGYGAILETNYVGQGSTKGGIANINYYCSNGQISWKATSAFQIRNSSEKNVLKGLVDYFHRHNNYWEIPEEEQLIIDYLQDEAYDRVFDDGMLESAFYDLMGKTFVTAINMEKSRYERGLVRAQETSVSDIVEEYKRIRSKYSSILSKSDIERLLLITETDPTIELDSMSKYTAIQAITRYANSPALSAVKSERLQRIGNELLLTVEA